MRAGFTYVCVVMVLVAVNAMAAKGIGNLSEAERKQVNEWMAERVSTMISANKLAGELASAWKDPEHTSPEIEELRKIYWKLQQQLIKTEQDLRQKVAELPALREKQQQLKELQDRTKELTDKVEEKVSLPK
jgi:hypothetical protein